MKTSIIITAALCVAFSFCKAEDKTTLADGDYNLVFTDISYIHPNPNSAQDTQSTEIILPAALTSESSNLVIQTKTPDGNQHTMHGRIADYGVSLWMSGFERDYMVTYHLTGKCEDADDTSGELSIFMGHDKVATGKWRLQKAK